MMYVEFPVGGEDRFRNLAYESLRFELRKWAHRHGINSDSISVTYHQDSGCERVTLANDRQLELFCLSWCPEQDYWQNYRVRRSI